MRTPRLNTDVEVPVPQWNLSSDEVAKVKSSFGKSNKIIRPPKTQTEIKRLISSHPHVRINPLQLTSQLPMWERFPFIKTIYVIRRNQREIEPTSWKTYITSIENIAQGPSPTYMEFVQVHEVAADLIDHTGHSWGAHRMAGHDGRNFLAWHREYLAKLETRLMIINPLVTIPYWNWVEDRAIPKELSDAKDLQDWGITRQFDASLLPDAQAINFVNQASDFVTFQDRLEAVHNLVHRAVGGTMQTTSAPADPLFWLHHAFIDKIWNDWQMAQQAKAGSFQPPNMNERLLPSPIFTSEVGQLVALSYTFIHRYV